VYALIVYVVAQVLAERKQNHERERVVAVVQDDLWRRDGRVERDSARQDLAPARTRLASR
jgi:hypothetical protein